ncbi:AAA family ATPase [Yersinia aleksiciae]|uniref:AAA family ATPase n=1 Tax=Yersinia aleksiciae TaxID=263819 RepID=UPI0025AAF984|nr:AAA family ATPase [Yersinia aleksiciae]MDN0122780.1 AAA family ATPase [Yersinia aleksiciae]
MITQLAISGYRSLREVVIELGQLNVITGANSSGKSSLYRVLRLLSELDKQLSETQVQQVNAPDWLWPSR